MRRMLAPSLTLMLLSACGPQQVVSTSGCDWIKPFVESDEELIVFAANIHVLRPTVDQINAQNKTRAAKCG